MQCLVTGGVGFRQRAKHILVPLRQQAAPFRHLLGVAFIDLEPRRSGTVVSAIAMRYGPLSNGR